MLRTTSLLLYKLVKNMNHYFVFLVLFTGLSQLYHLIVLQHKVTGDTLASQPFMLPAHKTLTQGKTYISRALTTNLLRYVQKEVKQHSKMQHLKNQSHDISQLVPHVPSKTLPSSFPAWFQKCSRMFL